MTQDTRTLNTVMGYDRTKAGSHSHIQKDPQHTFSSGRCAALLSPDVVPWRVHSNGLRSSGGDSRTVSQWQTLALTSFVAGHSSTTSPNGNASRMFPAEHSRFPCLKGCLNTRWNQLRHQSIAGRNVMLCWIFPRRAGFPRFPRSQSTIHRGARQAIEIFLSEALLWGFISALISAYSGPTLCLKAEIAGVLCVWVFYGMCCRRTGCLHNIRIVPGWIWIWTIHAGVSLQSCTDQPKLELYRHSPAISRGVAATSHIFAYELCCFQIRSLSSLFAVFVHAASIRALRGD